MLWGRLSLASTAGPPVAAEPVRPGARQGGNQAGSAVHPPHHVVGHLHEHHVVLAVEANLVGLVQAGLEGGAAIPGITGLPVAGHGGDGPVGSDFADHVVPGVTDIEGAVRPAHHPEGLVQLSLHGRAAVPGITRRPVAGHGNDFFPHRLEVLLGTFGRLACPGGRQDYCQEERLESLHG